MFFIIISVLNEVSFSLYLSLSRNFFCIIIIFVSNPVILKTSPKEKNNNNIWFNMLKHRKLVFDNKAFLAQPLTWTQ